jgi:hypothetical protein
MTKTQLVAILANLPPETEIEFSSDDYGDTNGIDGYYIEYDCFGIAVRVILKN